MIARLPFIARIGLLFALQAIALGWMVYDRARILRSGSEIRLAVRPIDPRDLLRGDYVTLAYDISSLRAKLLDGDDTFKRHDRLFVVLQQDSDGSAQPVSIHHRRPAVTQGQIVLAGRVRNVSSDISAPVGSHGTECAAPCPAIAVAYGIESYFVPEGQGRAIERQRDFSKMEVLAAVDSRGHAAIKGLIVDGRLRYEEPLF